MPKNLRGHSGGVGLLLCVLSCSPTFQPKPCGSDADCGGESVCAETESGAVCQSASVTPLRIGLSAPMSGPSQSLGSEMKKGISLAFDAQNAKGGIGGRSLELVLRDDQYVPTAAEAAVRDLLDVKSQGGSPRCPTTSRPLIAGQEPVATSALGRGPSAVLALLGNVGTPTMVRTAPIAVETGTLFFGAFTGADLMLRDGAAGPCAKYIFNVRASYADEARAATEYFLKRGVPDAAHLISFDQNDSFGQAGYDGLVKAYDALKGPDGASKILRVRYTRDDQASVDAQVQASSEYLAELIKDGKEHTVGVLMTDTYGPATTFITGLRRWQYQDAAATRQLKLIFSNVSFVGPNALADRLTAAGTVETPAGPTSFADDVFVTQVVPNYETDTGDLVRDYRALLRDTNLDPSFTSLEGYLAARIFIAGLLVHRGRFTPEALIETFEDLPDLAFGIGAGAGFQAGDHEYSGSVWGTAIDSNGRFSNEYFWAEGGAIQLFE